MQKISPEISKNIRITYRKNIKRIEEPLRLNGKIFIAYCILNKKLLTQILQK